MSIDYSRVQTLTNMEKALKENYLPVWRNGLTTEPTPLLGKIKKVKLTSNKIVTSAPFGLSGGFGFGGECPDIIESASLALYGAMTTKRNPNRKAVVRC